jgi:hypothetical protein
MAENKAWLSLLLLKTGVLDLQFLGLPKTKYGKGAFVYCRGGQTFLLTGQFSKDK